MSEQDQNIETLESLLSYKNEYEWFEFKGSWFSKDEIGQYISAIAYGACLCGKKTGYLVWGIEDKTNNVIGTKINFNKDIDGEPYKHYLARNLNPRIPFEVKEFEYLGKRIVMLCVSSSKSSITKYKDIGYLRIGSSKERIDKFPEWETELLYTIKNGYPTIVNTPAPFYAQELTFTKLLGYYFCRGVSLNPKTFEKTLSLKTDDGKYNVMAYILSDQNNLPIRVSIFCGKDKASPLFSVKEFGNLCVLYAVDKLLDFGDTLNIPQADERNRIVERKEVPLFDYSAYREALLNAFIHNRWLELNSPHIAVFTDRIEIHSRGGLANRQNLKGFFAGESVPVNEALASIFLQLHISERSGRGVPKIIEAYGENAFKIEKEYIVVTIPFNKINVNHFEIMQGSGKVAHKSEIPSCKKEKVAHKSKIPSKKKEKVAHKSEIPSKKKHDNQCVALNKTQLQILSLLRDNQNITIIQLEWSLEMSRSGIRKNLAFLQKKSLIARVGSPKKGYWKVLI